MIKEPNKPRQDKREFDWEPFVLTGLLLLIQFFTGGLVSDIKNPVIHSKTYYNTQPVFTTKSSKGDWRYIRVEHPVHHTRYVNAWDDDGDGKFDRIEASKVSKGSHLEKYTNKENLEELYSYAESVSR
jgi:hypothetical protein